MKFYQLTIVSKNKNLLENFFLFFFNNFIIKKKYFNKKKKIKKLTILKSPHVNKTSQEQFESRVFLRQFNFCLSNSLKYLVFSKKIKNTLFPDIVFKTQFVFNKQIDNCLKLNVFNLNNFKIVTNFYISQAVVLNNTKIKNFRKINYFIKIFDIYGEFKNFFYV